jgi:hypothetical protein
MARLYIFDGRKFWGFNKDFSQPHRLALCQDEDTFDVWALDEEDITESVDQLLRYFTASQSMQKLVGTYKEEDVWNS